MQTDARKRIANLTSNILNPFLVSLVICLLLLFASVSSTLEAIKWTLIAMVLSVLPIFLIVIYLVRNDRLDAIFINVRRQRTKIYLPACLCAVTGYFVLTYLRAPSILVAAFTAVFLMVVIFMLINLWWKISVHTAIVTGSVTALVMMYGWTAAATLVLVPLTAWSRIELEHHSLAQTATGALLAATIVAVVFYPLVLG